MWSSAPPISVRSSLNVNGKLSTRSALDFTSVYLHEPAPLLIGEFLVTQGSGGIGKDLCHKSRIIQHPHHDTLEMVMTHARMAPK